MKASEDDNIKTLNSSQFVSLLKSRRDDLVDFAIGFVKQLPHTDSDVTLAGSGTLVTAGNLHAILTAGHVVSKLPASGELGFVIPTVSSRPYHKSVIHAELLQRVLFYSGDESPQGPDLGLLVLPDTFARDLKSLKTFYNLDLRSDRILHQTPPVDFGGWVLNGILNEETEHLTPPKGEKYFVAFHGLTRYGRIIKTRCAETFDYLSFEPIYDDGREPPNTFQGCSGGGLWHALIEERDGSPVISELLLAGVAFYESEMENGRMIIECHGRQSIYESAVNALKAIASQRR